MIKEDVYNGHVYKIEVVDYYKDPKYFAVVTTIDGVKRRNPIDPNRYQWGKFWRSDDASNAGIIAAECEIDEINNPDQD